MKRSGVLVWPVLGALLAIFATVATVASARPGVVKTKDGQSYEGDVEEKEAESVTITIRGISTRIDRSRVASIEYNEGFEKQFQERLAKLDAKDAKGRIALAREAFENRKYLLARDALEQVLTIDPNNADAVALLETVRSQMRLESIKKHADEPPRETMTPRAGEPGAGAPATTEAAVGGKLLRPTDLNLIRQQEMRPEDAGVRLRFERDVKKRYAALKGVPLPQFVALSAAQQAQAILSDGLPEMKNDVQILSDPPALRDYRRIVQPFIISGCATAGCHGGASAPAFSLVVPADSDLATYTNFYILQQYSKEIKGGAGPFAGGTLKLIDRTHPADSLVLQYSLPTNMAQYRHPAVANYRPMLRGVDDPRYRQIFDWLHNSLKPVEPNYGIDYQLPGAASKPATAPAPAAPRPAATPPAPPATPPAYDHQPPPPAVRPTPPRR